MLDQGYTAGSFRRLLRPIDFSNARHCLPSDKGELEILLEDTENDFLNGKLDFSLLQKITIKGKEAYKTNDFLTDIVLRKLNDNIRRLYTIKQPDRTDIVRQIIELSYDGTPIQIIRRDIRSFFEEIPRISIISKINNDYLLGWESKKLLKDIFDSPLLRNLSGLPRGLGLSATLSELYIRPFDKYIKNIEGILYYSRYVDDIIILSYKNATSIEKNIEKKLGQIKLSLNEKKSPPPIVLPKDAKNLCACYRSCGCNKALEYLGYKISFPAPPSGWNRKKRGRYVSVSLSDDKLRRIKSRIVRSFVDYTKNNNHSLLEKRVSYLTSNYPLPLNKFKKHLKGGVYYNYPLISDMDVLLNLDTFLRKIIYSKNGTLGTKLSGMLNSENKNVLKRYSFYIGFNKRYFIRLSQKDITIISECWKYD